MNPSCLESFDGKGIAVSTLLITLPHLAAQFNSEASTGVPRHVVAVQLTPRDMAIRNNRSHNTLVGYSELSPIMRYNDSSEHLPGDNYRPEWEEREGDEV